MNSKSVSLESFRTGDLVFGETKEGEMRDGTRFKKTPISVRHPDGSVGPLIIISEPCFSFGVQKDIKYGGYSIPLVLIDRERPTEKQRQFVKVIKDILSGCDPKTKSCLYGSDDNNPIMYVKIDYDKERKVFNTKFFEREDMDNRNTTKKTKPEKYMGKRGCVAKVSMRIDNVFEAKTTSLQIRARTDILSEVKHEKQEEEDLDDTSEMS